MKKYENIEPKEEEEFIPALKILHLQDDKVTMDFIVVI